MDRFHRWGIVITVMVILTCFAVVFYTVFHDEGSIVVPQLVGMNLQEATDALSEIGLTAKVDEVESGEDANVILTQNIKPGTKVKQGRSLLLQVSKGGKCVKMPDVCLMKTEDAVKRLEREGFKVGKIVSVEDDERNPGTVLAQNPCSGQQVDSACSVELLVCAGGASSEGTVYVPNLRGKTAEAATEMLKKNGLEVGEKKVVNSPETEGTVVSTKPGIGARVMAGSVVDLVIADGQVVKKPLPAEGDVKKEHTVKAVKAEEKPLAKKGNTVANQEKKQIEDIKKDTVKTDTKKNSKEEQKKTQGDTKSVKIEAKQTATVAKTKEAETANTVKTTEEKQETKSSDSKLSLPEKSTKVRYVVPPLTKPMNLKITLQDAEGNHVLKDAIMQGNENISLPVKYKGTATLSILLGGESIWQETYK